MKCSPFSLSTGFLLVLSSISLAYQTGSGNPIAPTVRQGALSTSGLALLRNDTAGELLFRPSGSAVAPPGPWTVNQFGAASSTHPVYTPEAVLFGGSGPPAGTSPLHMRAVCSGNVVQPQVAFNGQLTGNGQAIWFAFSVTISGSQAPPAGFLFEQPNSGARIVSHYTEDSTGISPALVGNTVLEQDSFDMGFASAEPVDIGDFDYAMAYISENPVPVQGSFVDRLVNVRDKFYFTLHPTSQTVSMPWGPNGSSIAVNSATVYVATWNPARLAWDAPRVAYGHGELGLSPHEEIDAIAVDHDGGQIIFSTDLHPSTPMPTTAMPSQLMVFRSGMNEPQQLKVSSGDLMTEKLGLRTGNSDPNDVTGTCGWDPEAFLDYSFHAGTPEYDPQSETDPMGISVARSTYTETPDADRVQVLRIEASGVQADPSRANFVVFCTQPLIGADPQPDFDPAPNGTPGGAWQVAGWVPIQPGQTQAQLEINAGTEAPNASGTPTLYAVAGIHVAVNPATGNWTLGRRTIVSKISVRN